jgi:hypothetical protein
MGHFDERLSFNTDPAEKPEDTLLSRRNVLGISCAALAMLVLQACGGGGGGGGNNNPPDEGDFFRATNVSVKDNVVVVPDDGTVTVSNLTPTGLTLTGAVPALVVGSVIVSGIGAGLMRKVVSVTTSGADTIVVTEDAPLTDVFNSANVEFRKELSADHVQEIQTHIDGVEVSADRSRGRGRAAATSFQVFVPKTFVGEQEGETKVGVEIEATGVISVALTGSFDITLANGLERLTVISALVWNGSYKFAILGETEFFKKEIPYATFIFNPVPIGAIGPVPIVVLPVLHLQLAATGSVQGGWETSGTGVSTYVMGLNFVQAPLGSDFSVSQIHPVGSQTHTGTFVGSNFYATLKFEAAGWQPELLTSFNGLIGPVFKGDIPAVALELKANSATKTVDFTSDAIFRGRVGADAGMFAFSWPLFEVTAIEGKIPIKYKTFKPGDGNVGIS